MPTIDITEPLFVFLGFWIGALFGFARGVRAAKHRIKVLEEVNDELIKCAGEVRYE